MMRSCILLCAVLCRNVMVAAAAAAASAKVPPQTPPRRPDTVLQALSEGRDLYYFGLGSNMLRSKIENRGTNGTKIELISMEPATVPGYRLAFNMRGFPPLEPGMGSLEPWDAPSRPLRSYHSRECHGALVRLTPENYEKVMRSEGVGNHVTDPGYEEIVVDAYPYGSDDHETTTTTPVKAIALRARPHARLAKDPAPSERYMNILGQGAAELGLKQCYQQFLADHPTHQSPAWLRRMAINNMIFVFSMAKQPMKPTAFSRFQSRLLFLVYHGGTGGPRKALSDLGTAAVLMPGAIFGTAVKLYHKATKKELPMFLSRMIKIFDDSKAKI